MPYAGVSVFISPHFDPRMILRRLVERDDFARATVLDQEQPAVKFLHRGALAGAHEADAGGAHFS